MPLAEGTILSFPRISPEVLNILIEDFPEGKMEKLESISWATQYLKNLL